MTFPVPGTPVTYADNTGTVSVHPVTLPAVLSGKCIIEFVSNSSSAVTTPGGWTLLAGPNATPVSYDTVNIFGRDLNGTEGASVNITVAANQRACAIAVASTGGRTGFSASEIAISTITENGNVTTADPPNLAPSWAAEDTLWLAGASGNDANSTFTSYPTNYTGLAQVLNGTGNGNSVAMAYRQLNAASENPGVFTYGNTKFRTGVTIAIRPAAPAAGGARSYGMILGRTLCDTFLDFSGPLVRPALLTSPLKLYKKGCRLYLPKKSSLLVPRAA